LEALQEAIEGILPGKIYFDNLLNALEIHEQCKNEEIKKSCLKFVKW
jgi:hypothetical protein